MSVFSWLAFFFSSLGALNWGFVYFLRFNLVEYICEMIKVDYLKEIIYGLIAFCGFYALVYLFVG
jgi:uncharacterized membrane protein YuzA (DUF378 family)